MQPKRSIHSNRGYSCLESLDFVANDEHDDSFQILSEATDKALKTKEEEEEEVEHYGQVEDDMDCDARLEAKKGQHDNLGDGQFFGNHTHIIHVHRKCPEMDA